MHLVQIQNYTPHNSSDTNGSSSQVPFGSFTSWAACSSRGKTTGTEGVPWCPYERKNILHWWASIYVPGGPWFGVGTRYCVRPWWSGGLSKLFLWYIVMPLKPCKATVWCPAGPPPSHPPPHPFPVWLRTRWKSSMWLQEHPNPRHLKPKIYQRHKAEELNHFPLSLSGEQPEFQNQHSLLDW